MYWQAIFVVALAAPVWSLPHNHRHNQACPAAGPSTITRLVTVTAGVVSAAEAAEAAYTTTKKLAVTVEDVRSSETAQPTTTYATQETARVAQTTTVYAVQTTVSKALAATSVAIVSTETTQETARAAQTTAVYAVQPTLSKALVATSVATVSTKTTQTTASATSTTSAPGRAIWLWQSDLLKDDDEVAKFLSFAQSNDITSVYTLIDRDMGDAVFQNFIEQCTSIRVSVEALMGNSDWILGLGDPTLESQLEWLENYHGNSTANQQFSAIHMDIEPWGLDGWASNEATYTLSLQTIVQQITSLGATLGLPVAADLPYWAETITCPTSGKTLDIWMLENLDTATFMTYRNTASELLDIATSVLEAGNTAGKPVWLAVETVDAADAILISYYGKTFSTLSNDLVAINTTAATYASFAGIAIHDYGGALALSS